MSPLPLMSFDEIHTAAKEIINALPPRDHIMWTADTSCQRDLLETQQPRGNVSEPRHEHDVIGTVPRKTWNGKTNRNAAYGVVKRSRLYRLALRHCSRLNPYPASTRFRIAHLLAAKASYNERAAATRASNAFAPHAFYCTSRNHVDTHTHTRQAPITSCRFCNRQPADAFLLSVNIGGPVNFGIRVTQTAQRTATTEECVAQGPRFPLVEHIRNIRFSCETFEI